MYKPVKGNIKPGIFSKGGSDNATRLKIKKPKPRALEDNYQLDFLTYGGDFKEKTQGLSFEMLKHISINVPPISAIISTRVNQVASFSTPSRYADNGLGFKVKVRGQDDELTTEQEEKIRQIESFISNCGKFKDKKRDNFDTFLRKIVRDSLTYDQVNFEIVRDDNGKPFAFHAVDASTIRAANEDIGESEDITLPLDGEEIAYAQVIDGVVKACFSYDEMAFSVRNPRSDIYSQPYGLSEIETITRQLSSYLDTEEYNMRFFQQGGMTKGILNITEDPNGIGGQSSLDSFKRQWRNQVSGQKGAWRIPVFQLPGKLEFINIAQTGGEMVFEKWINYLINISCAVYAIDPAEINFPNNGGVGGNGGGIFEGSNAEKYKNSKSKGLIPLLQFIRNTINKFIIQDFGEEYEFVFEGLDNKTEEEQVDLDKKKSETYLTVNEVRRERGLEPLEDGDIILNPYFMQAMQSGGGGSDGGFDFDFGDDEMEDTGEVAEDNTEEDMNKSILIIEEYNPEEDLVKAKNLSKLVPVILSVTNKNGTTFERKYYKKPNELKKILEQKIKETKVENPVIIDKKAGKVVTKDAIIETIKRNPNIPMNDLLKERYKIVKGNKPKNTQQNEANKKDNEINKEREKINFNKVTPVEFRNTLIETKKTVNENYRWRVDIHDSYDDIDKIYTSDGGSTLAVKDDGDIVSICKNYNEDIYGEEILEKAVELGGIKLDSFSGNHDFYQKCGFKAVSWCKFEEEHAPEDWDKDRDKPEPVVFYKYVGKPLTDSEDLDDFLRNNKPFKNYKDAQDYRDKEIEEN